MKQYLNTLSKILTSGTDVPDRTGTGARSIFGLNMRFNLADGFPAVTTKRLAFRSMAAELLWFLSGSTNVKDLQAMGCTIWDEWARDDGELGPVYGKQWVRWATPRGSEINQIHRVIEGLRRDPHGRRHVVSAWNPADINDMALPPCHAMFQFHVTPAQPGGRPRLSCQLYQRSADMFLGVPFNIASYALLTHMIAQQVDMDAGDFVWVGGDCHVYHNHITQALEQLSRDLRPLPRLVIKRRPASIFKYRLEDFALDGYDPHPPIQAPIAV